MLKVKQNMDLLSVELIKIVLKPTPASYTPVLHDVEVPQLHDLLLPLVDVGEILDLLQREQSSQTSDRMCFTTVKKSF